MTTRGTRVRSAGRTAPELADPVDAPVTAAGPTGHPGIEPLVVATTGSESRFVPNATPEELRRVVDAGADELPEEGSLTATQDAEPATVPTPESEPLSVGTGMASARCGWADPEDGAAYRDWGVADD